MMKNDGKFSSVVHPRSHRMGLFALGGTTVYIALGDTVYIVCVLAELP